VGEDSSPPGHTDVWFGREGAAVSVFRAFQEQSGPNTRAEWLFDVKTSLASVC
jgi:hypothetical protein